MSFEGFTQHICKNGHYGVEPYDYAGDQPKWTCHECHEGSVWSNLVDDTNCDNHGYIKPVVKVPEHYDSDGNYIPDTYEIPTSGKDGKC